MLEWLVTARGAEVIPEIADALDKYDDLPSVIEAVSGMPIGQAQAEWHGYLEGHQRQHHSLW